MIRYEGVTKIFGSGREEVVALKEITFEIQKGELVVFLGPSGCGKTTLLRLTNRLIPLTRGTISVNGQDITSMDPVRLRQSMGYAIQAVGLFPNKTIFGNIATVPRLLGWEEDRIQERVDELLGMLQLDPSAFGHRYPAELSGGQQQRVGVARCLAADPEILLMDEPFGAIDPINREEIQNQFLRVQGKLKKTIAFVTHDIHEAIKMGDKIAIFQEGKLIQYDTPEAILTHPKNEYIADFVGADRALKVLGLLRAKDALNRKPENILEGSQDAREALAVLREKDLGEGIVADPDRPVGYVTPKMLEQGSGPVREMVKAFPKPVEPYHTLKDVMSTMLMQQIKILPVVDEHGALLGVLRMEDIERTILDIYEEKGGS
ncbi:MAG: ABC transporter ATP-binding protein [Thermodesulfobacteriota bacterium]